MQEETKIETPSEAPVIAPEEAKVFVQGEKSETVETALSAMRELRKKYELAGTEGNENIKMQDLNLYEFPKMISAIKAVEAENEARKGKGELPFRIDLTDEYKAMKKFGLNYFKELKNQEELNEQAAEEYIKKNNQE